LTDSPEAQLRADKFYTSALGVKSVNPMTLYDFENGGLKPVMRPGNMMGFQTGRVESFIDRNTGLESNPMLTTQGNLQLVRRPIESRDNIATRWSIKFIDMTTGNYNTAAIRYSNKVQSSSDALEPGQSQWLKYDPLFNENGE
jgi:hypothetical protein